MLFENIVGHAQLKKKLMANVLNSRISHAQLFYGPEGCGHLPLALAFARYIQCRNRSEDDACGSCASCLKFNKLEHPDLHFFFPVATNQEVKKDVSSRLFYTSWRAFVLKKPYFSYTQWLTEIGIENKQAIINAEDCNDIIRVLGLKSYESPYKIVIIYMVEKLYHAAAPKLLKILEEPPDNTLFILISENKENILNTILSRTQLVKIPSPAEDDIIAALTRSYQVPAQEARHIAFATGGNFAEALQIVREQDAPYDHFDNFRQWMRICYKPDMQQLFAWIDNMAKTGRERQKSFLSFGTKIIHMCLMRHHSIDRLISLDDEEKEFLERFYGFIHAQNTLKIFDAFEKAHFHIERNANAKIVFADLSLTLTQLLKASKS